VGEKLAAAKKGRSEIIEPEHGTLNMRVRDETGLIFQLRKAKEKSSRALRKFRRLTIHPMLYSIIALTGRVEDWRGVS
jgi:hypothetical protein